MNALMSPAALQDGIEELASGECLVDAFDLIGAAIELLTPPESISTVDCAEKYRKLPGPEDGAVIPYDRWRTPHNIGPMNALDDEACNLLVMPKPSRSGGTAVMENYVFKRIKFGPMTWVSWVLNSDEAVTAYCRNVVKPMFELNPDLQARVGTARGDDTDAFKKIRGYPVEWLSAKDSTFRNRQPGVMVLDESDANTKKYQSSPRTQIDGRQKLLGNRKKGAIISHPDLGWKAGVGAAYEDTSRGIFVLRCCHCLSHAAAYATKFWPGVPQFKLDWQKDPEASTDERLDMAEKTAAIYCPHCGAAISDDERRAMIDAAVTSGGNAIDGYMHRGQRLDPEAGVIGDPDPTPNRGFWVHGTMLKTETMGKLARDYQAALIHYERTRDPKLLKEFMSKQLGEIFEGAATLGNLSADKVMERAKPSDQNPGYDRGTVPAEVRFITAAVDTGARKFDVAFKGWDLEGRSWLIDRLTIRQRRHADGTMRDLHLSQNVDDWLVLIDEVVERRFPLEDDPDLVMPVACICVDSGDGNVTWKAREFARRALTAGHVWGKRWAKVKLIKGASGKRPAVPDAPRKVDKGEDGKPVEPVIVEYTLGADELKVTIYERLAIDDGSPGECSFYRGFEQRFADEFFGETKTDGKWVRSGPNETLDLYGYAEAARQILKPDRADIKWAQGKLPPWAKPVPLQPKGGDPVRGGNEAPAQAEPKKKRSTIDRFAALNQRN
ncbi:terminase gpA endonuclease subunit [Novosphingobium sp. KN65.2]|uniref:terminase gpA endonuclease subunit n=1 Tax=Novosphingobium sp. KN65.2 TaxID=1478134 RepID=UPI0005DB4684|nr:terminase gpA endonuclease subunit [Novosphingobium sp. KN65.2]CDO34057.1 hypothetical protein SPHV1_100091 [Novosphingobium sp. KN65.2]